MLGSEAFTSSFTLCSRDMRAAVVFPSDSHGTVVVRSKTHIRGTPPNCADTYTLSLILYSSEPLPSDVVLVQANCPASHVCVPFLFASDRHSCNSCSAPICAGSRGWRCFDCNYDVCHSCHTVESNCIDPKSIISSHSVSGICCDTWKSVTLCTCAFGDYFMQLGLHNQSKAPALLVNSSLSGKDAEGWAGHHGAAFACTSVAYLKKVVVC